MFCRQASGANIKIADLDEGSQDRHVTISGTPEQIQLAEFLIHSRYEKERFFVFVIMFTFFLELLPKSVEFSLLINLCFVLLFLWFDFFLFSIYWTEYRLFKYARTWKKISNSISSFFFYAIFRFTASTDVCYTLALMCVLDFCFFPSLTDSWRFVFVNVTCFNFHLFHCNRSSICNDLLSVLFVVWCNDIDLCLYVAVQQWSTK